MSRAKTKKTGTLSAARLMRLLAYDPDTGCFSWRSHRSSNARAGEFAGSRHIEGYWSIRIDGALYLAHRLAWLYVNGRWPADQIDHINGDRSDNRIANLRECSNAQNCQNIRSHRDGTSGLLGASWEKRRKKWQSHICVNGKIHWLGYFDTAVAAHDAYIEAKGRLHTFGRAA